jgi:isoquinoline 1-oxidoreductase subunit beta
MAFGAIVMPAQQDSRIIGANVSKAQVAAGVIKVVVDLKAQCVGVVANTRAAAQAAAQLIQLKTEGGSAMSQQQLEAFVQSSPGEGTAVRKRGKAFLDTVQLIDSRTVVNASFRTPLAAHAHLEPLTATASIIGTVLQVWIPTQDVDMELDLLKSQWGSQYEIKVNPMPMGGSFGRKGFQSTATPASILAQASGQPVTLAWTREQEMRNSFYRHPTHSTFRGHSDSSGKINAIEQTLCSGYRPIIDREWNFLDKLQSSIEIDASMFTGLFSLYDIPNYRSFIRSVKIPVKTGIWRGVALAANQFAFESFIDEMAVHINADPIQFRQRNLLQTEQGQRMNAVLELVKQKSDWSSSTLSGYGRGVACSYFSNTAVAAVIEARRVDQQIRVGRVTVAIDAGLVVNPAGAKLQAVGSVIMGLSSALYEKLTIKNSAIEQTNFDQYRIMKMSERPERIDVHFIDSNADPHGLGEPVIGPIAPALANALFRIAGKRSRELPLT